MTKHNCENCKFRKKDDKRPESILVAFGAGMQDGVLAGTIICAL